jgi:hypothetical protein
MKKNSEVEIRLPEKAGVEFKGQTFYLVNELEGTKLYVDVPTQTVHLGTCGAVQKSVLRKASPAG